MISAISNAWDGLTGTRQRNRAVSNANAALGASKMTADGLIKDTEALINPNIQNQIGLASDAVMGQFGGSGDLYGSATQKALADRAQAIGSQEWSNAQNRAMAMQQGNQDITASIQKNKLANAMQQPSVLDRVGAIGDAVGKILPFFG